MTFCATRAAHLAAPVSMSLTRLFSCRCCILAAVRIKVSNDSLFTPLIYYYAELIAAAWAALLPALLLLAFVVMIVLE